MKVQFAYLITYRKKFNSFAARNWIRKIIEAEGRKPGKIIFIFSGNDYLQKLNKEFLNHDYATDVITFSDNIRDLINGEIYISLEQVRLNANSFKSPERNELLRVMVHGVLHLIGYEDDVPMKRAVMSEKEDEYIVMAMEQFKLMK